MIIYNYCGCTFVGHNFKFNNELSFHVFEFEFEFNLLQHRMLDWNLNQNDSKRKFTEMQFKRNSHNI